MTFFLIKENVYVENWSECFLFFFFHHVTLIIFAWRAEIQSTESVITLQSCETNIIYLL